MSAAIVDTLARPEFGMGLLSGALVTLGVAAAKRATEKAPTWGALLALATLAGVITTGLSGGLTLAGAVLALALAYAAKNRFWLSVLVMGIGAALVGLAVGRAPLWVQALAAVGVIPIGFLVERAPRSRLVPVLLLVSIGGVLITTPDTEPALLLLGAGIPVLLLAVIRALPLGSGGGYPMAGVFVWAVAWGGAGRAGAVVGGLACLGVLVVLPLWGIIGRHAGLTASPLAVTVVVSGHAAAVFIAGRIAGMRTGALEALPLALLALAVAAGAVAGAAWLSGRAGRATLAQSPPSGGPRSRGAA